MYLFCWMRRFTFIFFLILLYFYYIGFTKFYISHWFYTIEVCRQVVGLITTRWNLSHHSKKWIHEIFNLFIFRSGVEAKRGIKLLNTQCLQNCAENTRFPLPTLLRAGYSVKQKHNFISHWSYTYTYFEYSNTVQIILWCLRCSSDKRILFTSIFRLCARNNPTTCLV